MFVLFRTADWKVEGVANEREVGVVGAVVVEIAVVRGRERKGMRRGDWERCIGVVRRKEGFEGIVWLLECCSES